MRRSSPTEVQQHGAEQHRAEQHGFEQHGTEQHRAELVIDAAADQVERSVETMTHGRGSEVQWLLAAGAVVVVLLFLFADGGGPTADRAVPRADGAAPASADASGQRFAPWPDPPQDHDPHVAGRPGSQQPVRADLAGRTLVYVNSLGRPTVIDLSTGDQRELEIAGPRLFDRFYVEFGRIVSPAGNDGELPPGEGRALLFSVRRTPTPVAGAEAPFDTGALTGPVLCLDAGGCSGASWQSGEFGNDRDRVSSVDETDPIAAISEVVDSGSSTEDGRWTTLSMDIEDPSSVLRIPTPLSTSVVWLIAQFDGPIGA